MSQAIPIDTSSWVGHDLLNSLLGDQNAISEEARDVRREASEVFDAFEHTQSLFGDKLAAISQLRAIAIQCADEGWDGENGCGIEPDAVLLAERFLLVLPEDVVVPECAPEPDGSISLDWIQSRNRLFSVSIGTNDRLAYAWLDGTDRGHAVARFDGLRIPPRILEGVRSIVGPS